LSTRQIISLSVYALASTCISIKEASFSSTYTHKEFPVVSQLLFQLKTHNFYSHIGAYILETSCVNQFELTTIYYWSRTRIQLQMMIAFL